MLPSRRFLLPGLVLALAGLILLCARILSRGADGSIAPAGGGELLAAEGGELSPGRGAPGAVEGDETGRREALPSVVHDLAGEGAEASAETGPRLYGRVVRAGDAPVEAAEIVLRHTQPWLAVPADLEEMSALPSAGPRYEASTDGDGVFELRNVKPGKFALSIRASGCSPLTRDSLPIPVHESFDLGTFELEPGVRVSGRVIGPRGEGVAGTQVLSAVSPDSGSLRLELPGHGIPLTESDEEGRFEVDGLAPGSWHLIFDHPEYRVAELKGVTEPAGRIEGGKRVDLVPGLSIEGRVEGLDPVAAGPLRVTARCDREQPAGAADDVQGAERHRPRHAEVRADGTFAVRGLAPGLRCKLQLSRPREPSPDDPEGIPLRWVDVRGVDDEVAMAGDEGIVLTYRAESSVALQVVDADSGRPVESFVVVAAGGGLGGGGVLKGDDDEARTHFPGGKALYEGLRPAEKGSEITVSVRADGYEDFAKEGLMLWPGKPVDLGKVELAPATRVAVKVLDGASGKPIAGAQVLVARNADAQELERWNARGEEKVRRAWGQRKVRDAVSDERGVARLTVWPAAVCAIRAFAPGYLPGTEHRSIPPHEETIEASLSRGGRVVVRVEDGEGLPVAGVFVEHAALGGRSANRGRRRFINFGLGSQAAENESDDRGEVVFDELEGGEHRFKAVERRNPWDRSGKPSGPEAVEEVFLAEGEERTVELRVPARGGFIARILESGTPLSGALARLTPADQQDNGNNMFWFGSAREDPRTRITDHAGRVHFDRLEVGPYRLSVSHPERRMTLVRDVEVVREPVEIVLDIGLATIAGRVVDPLGDPIQGVRITVMANDQRQTYEAGDYRVKITEDAEGDMEWDMEQVKKWAIESDRSGEFVLRGVLPEVPLRVQARHRYVVGATARAGPLGRDEYLAGFDFVLERAGVLRVSVPGARTSENRNRRIEVRAARMAEGKAVDRRTERVRNWRSEVRMESLLPGEWRVRLFVDGGQEAVAEVEVEISAGRTEEISLPL